MHITFKKVILHNFLSYGHSEIDLQDRQYCLVSGINNYKLDNSKSNGAGKSTWSSAICFALTGETSQGKSKDLKNNLIDEKSCYVRLLFAVDENEFDICRYKEPKSDLTISVNGEDKSGKGIKESEAILASYLPDLSGELLGSIIILGQGLPCKFTANTPSGRKEVLEKLSKSDFMIQDIKDRLAAVYNENQTELRKYEDTLLKLDTELNLLKQSKNTNLTKLAELEKPQDFDAQIEQLTKNIEDLEKLIIAHSNKLLEADTQLKEHNSKLNEINTEKGNILLKEEQEFNECKSAYLIKKSEITAKQTADLNALTITFNSDVNSLKSDIKDVITNYKLKISAGNQEVTRMKSIKDVCPTCGQKLPNVVKPDTSKLEADITSWENEVKKLEVTYNTKAKELQESYDSKTKSTKDNYSQQLTELETKFKGFEISHNSYKKQIDEQYADSIKEINTLIAKVKSNIDLYTNDKRLKEQNLNSLKLNLQKLILDKDNHQLKLKEVKEALLSIDNNIKKLEEEILYNNNKRSEYSDKISIDNKLSTLIKRDFRGFLLSNVISFIDKKAKEYSVDIFGHDQIEFTLDGNNIDITFLNKSFDNLSGGEKQKIDLIIQFAIRDMMTQYLDFSSNILVLDEIFDQLDVVGCTNVLNLISTKLNDIESMFIISHRSDELAIPYDCEMNVIKDETGISKVSIH